jgi:hypothetical protein
LPLAQQSQWQKTLQKFKFWEKFDFYQQLNNDGENPLAPGNEQEDQNNETSVYYDFDQLDDMVSGEGKEAFQQQIEFETAALEVEEQAKKAVKKVVEETEEEKLGKRLERLEELNENMAKQMTLLLALLQQKNDVSAPTDLLE